MKAIIAGIILFLTVIGIAGFLIGYAHAQEVGIAYILGTQKMAKPIIITKCTPEDAARWWTGEQDLDKARINLCGKKNE